MEVVALIPARGGSKAIPRKNLAPLGGRPILAWTVDAARESRAVTRTVVSTEDEEIAAAARGLGAEVLDRPAELSADETPMQDVIEHALAELPRPDVLVLLQPTSPLRRARHVDEAVPTRSSASSKCRTATGRAR
jgi:CMP-N-acetylneuraminic acid synthetase